ncbi:MAG: hypothetical protein ACLQHF_03060 [Terracidiphilus sp.]
MDDPRKRRIRAEIERLVAEADKLPEGGRRRELVDRIAVLNIEYQAVN